MPHDIKALLAHISSLEMKVKYFEQHHQRCPLNNLVSPPIDRESDESSGDNNQQSTSPGFEIIPYEYQHDADISKPRELNPNWRKAADQLLKNVQSTTEWALWIAKLKSSDDDETASIITEICGVPSQFPGHKQRTPDPQDDGVMASAKAYARATKVSHDTASYVLKLHTFRVLVFVSLCAVLEALDYPVDDINEVMRICVSNSSDTNLKRLRSGAVWVNRRIAGLNTALGGHATEVREVCDALGYTTDTEQTTQLCRKYANLCDCACRELSEPSTRKRKRNLEDAPGTKRQMTTVPGDRSDIDTITSTSEHVALGRPRGHPIPAQPALTRPHGPPGGWGESSGMDMLIAVAEAQQAQENGGNTQRIVTVHQVNDNGTGSNFELTSQGMDRSG
ncbi:hypothetical protein DL98DRAFT_596809 [Cadophora sp. DSE1049]|nr:hypothetical protein DL98DRAFT_596809 [Cadophora sp. DSE1049]